MRDAVDASLTTPLAGVRPEPGTKLVRERRRRLALAASALLHVVGFAVASRFVWTEQQRSDRSHDQIITITHRVRPVASRHVAVKPAPVAAVRAPVVVPLPKRIAHVTPATHAAVAPAVPARTARAAAAKPAVARALPHAVAHRPAVAYVPHVPAVVPPGAGSRRLGAAQLARLNRDFAQTIAQAREGAPDPLAGTSAGAAGSGAGGAGAEGGTKSYGPALQSSTEGELRHSGLCDPVKDWTQDGYDYYYVICNVKFSDGTFRREGVPWPVRFPPGNDPFTGTAHAERPLSMPLPGWTLGPGETITKELREYAHEHGVEIAAP